MDMRPDMILFWVALWSYLAATVGACIYAGTRKPVVRGIIYVITLAGLTSQTVALGVRWAVSGHPPVTGPFDYMLLLSWAAVLAFVVIWRTKGLELLTAFAAPVGVLGMGVASLFPSRIEQQLIPALQSYWLWIHVSLAALAEAAFAVSFVAAVMYMIGDWRGWKGLPDKETLDMVTYRAIGVGFPLFTIGALLAGAIWANSAWGAPWSWDPKETSSLIVWLVYAIYLHARFVKGWRGVGAARLAALGFLVTLFTVLGSRFLGGLHSYGA